MEQEYFALQKLISLNKIAENAVFVPGHSGAIAGDLVSPTMADPLFSYVDYALETTFSHTFPRKKDAQLIRDDISFLDDSELKKQYPPYLIYENWRLQESNSKFNHNGAKIWDFFGYEYLLPLWDAELFNFFVKVPLSHKYDKNLYKETLGELFSEYNIFFPNVELYPSEALIRKVSFRSKLKKQFPFLKKFVNIWKSDRTGSEFYLKSFIEELKQAGCYRKMLNINGILSAWYLLEVRRRLDPPLIPPKGEDSDYHDK
jgi:asparagine synthase (glutamine-hydrolysing)